MATPEIKPNETWEYGDIQIWCEQHPIGGTFLITLSDGWKKREIELDVDRTGALLESIEDEHLMPAEERDRFIGTIAVFAKMQAQILFGEGIITLEAPDGSLYLALDNVRPAENQQPATVA